MCWDMPFVAESLAHSLVADAAYRASNPVQYFQTIAVSQIALGVHSQTPFPSCSTAQVPSTSWPPAVGDMLPTALQLHILSLLPHNERVLSGRLTCRDARDNFADQNTAFLSQPLPPHSAQWAMAAGEQHMQHLPFKHKLCLVSTAAASGCETNLSVAMALQEHSILPGMLQTRLTASLSTRSYGHCEDPGEAAVKAGHPELLGWLVHHCPGPMDFSATLAAAARHCDLAGLQAAAQVLLKGIPRFGGDVPLSALLSQDVLNAAAGSATPDAVAKVEWVLATSGGSCSLQARTAAAAYSSGNVSMLCWLQGRGCPMDAYCVLACTLEHKDFAAVEKLVEEEGCNLPAPGDSSDKDWDTLLQAAAKSADGAAKLQWLEDHGAPLLQLDDRRLYDIMLVSLQAGHTAVVSYLLARPVCSALLQRDPVLYVIHAGSIPVAEVLLAAGARFDRIPYSADKAMIRWLVQQVGVAVGGWYELQGLIQGWPSNAPADGQDLLEAVQVVVGAGTQGWGVCRAGAFWVLNTAAKRGDLPLVQHLVQHLGCVPNEQTLRAAARGGCVPLVEWLVDRWPGMLGTSPPNSPYIDAAVNGDRATLVTLRRLGVPWGAKDVVAKAVEEGCERPGLEWLVDHGAPVGTEEDMEGALALFDGSDDEDGDEHGGGEQEGAWGSLKAWLRGLVAEARQA